MNQFSVAIAGSTGLIGSQLRSKLAQERSTEKVLVFARRKLMQYLNEEVILTDFSELPDQVDVGVNVAVCALGTTIKRAGTKEAFRLVDVDMVAAFAKWCQSHGASTFVVISSIGADQHSSNFYLRTKGEMEEQVSAIGFERTIILRPSLLVGERKEFRIAEKVGLWVARLCPFVFTGKFKKYQPVHAIQVVKTLLDKIAVAPSGLHIISSEEIALYSKY